MTAHEEAKEWLTKAWDSLWVEDLSTLPDFFNENAEVSGFAPPKQMTWKGLDAIKAHFKEIQPIVSNKSFTIKRVDIVEPGKVYYAAWDAEYEMKVPGLEGGMEGSGIMYCVREGGKFQVLTAYEDPTPFVAMAMKGLGAPPHQ